MCASSLLSYTVLLDKSRQVPVVHDIQFDAVPKSRRESLECYEYADENKVGDGWNQQPSAVSWRVPVYEIACTAQQQVRLL